MSNKKAKTKSAKQSAAPPDNAVNHKKSRLTPKRLETVVAILLGIATLLSAWAAWISSLHGGIQSINFTKSNNMASQGTAEYNMGMQLYVADVMAWNTAKEYYYQLEEAKADKDQNRIDLINDKIERFKRQSVSDNLAEGIRWMEANHEEDPFKMPGMTEKYFESAQSKLTQSQELLEEGMRDNTKGDSYRLVTVMFSLTLFLLGIVNTFKDMPNRIAVMSIAFVFMIVAVIYMCTIPMPTGFAQMNFFDFDKR